MNRSGSIIDITRELLSAPVYPGDPVPELKRVSDTFSGDPFTLGVIRTGLHVGTHCDAPLHIIQGGKDISGMDPEHFIGPCIVLTLPEGQITEADFFRRFLPEGVKRLLLRSRGTSFLSETAGRFLLDHGVITAGTDGFSLAPPGKEETIHTLLLGGGMALIESLDLDHVPDGTYFLSALPLRIQGAEAAPCRAVLFPVSISMI